MTTKTDVTFDQIFVRVNRDVEFGCECCGSEFDGQPYQLLADPRAAYACRDCCEQYVAELNDGMWEDDRALYEY